ncbi:MAG: T9SS type A sorting domain-containing protein [Bacteroidetes bacterium]|nr:T9SS type A sorting domain-containing protein [Bacteroidota bacterium]
MKLRLPFLLTVLLLLFHPLAHLKAQLADVSQPLVQQKAYEGLVLKQNLPSVPPRPEVPEDDNAPFPRPAGYVIGHDVVFGMDEDWQVDVVHGVRYWRTTVVLDRPASVAFYFGHFDPGSNGRLYVTSDESDWVGAFTRKSSAIGEPFAIAPMRGRKFTLHFELPEGDKDFYIRLSQLGVMYDEKTEKGFGTSGPCEVNVNCSEGDNWQQQKRGVVRILVRQGSFLFYCSGSLINNTANDGTPYLLTANHCGENASASDYAQWVFSFNYESATCTNPLVEPVYRTMTGASLVSRAIPGTQSGSDFKLLRLNQNVPAWYQPYYNGWSRRNQISSTGVGIHHPDGDLKKISTYTSQPVSSGYGTGGNNPNEKYWRVQWSATPNGHGVTEGGSSGSPLFNSDGLIAGMLTGGSSSCSNTSGFDFYGKFSFSWESNGQEAANQLRPWLDPLNTGQEVLQGLDSDPLFLVAGFTAARNEIAINQFVEFDNTSGGYIENYAWHFPGGEPSTSNKQNPGPILYRSYGNFDVQLIVSNPVRSDTLIRKNYVQVKPFVYPNPSDGEFVVSFGVDLTADIEVSVFDAFGREQSALVFNQTNKLRILLPQAAKGIYLLKIRDRYVEKQLKVLIVR